MNENKYFELLKVWCDNLLKYQIAQFSDKELNGAIICPACKIVHGRIDNLIYPLLYLTEKTCEDKYLNAAIKLFDWHENLICDDGSCYNDGNNPWRGITVFSAVGLCESLNHFSDILPNGYKKQFEERLHMMAEWLYNNLTEKFPSNINYQATNACAMALCGKYFNNKTFLKRAKELLKFVTSRFTEDGLLYGEGRPIDEVTKNNCRPIDIGYNVEESVPAILKAARVLGDSEKIEFLKEILYKQLDFMLPDGAWDNSFGSRNNKWTYWGSRTSDGCAAAYTSFGEDEPILMEAARRNVELLLKTTNSGLLFGGPDYYKHGENPCLHHSICHAVSLCESLMNGLSSTRKKCDLPSDDFTPRVKYYKEIATYKIIKGNYISDITNYDYTTKLGHAAGGTLTLLYHKEKGAIIAGSVTDYVFSEPLNMQLTKKVTKHRSLVPRIEYVTEDKVYTNTFDTNSEITCMCENEKTIVKAITNLKTSEKDELENSTCYLDYEIGKSGVKFIVKFNKNIKDKATFILPIISDDAEVSIINGNVKTEKIFFLVGGFEATEYTIRPNKQGEIEFILK